MFKKHSIFASMSLLFVATHDSHAQFWDQGFNNPVIRSDYAQSNKGTSANPITIDDECLFVPSPTNSGSYPGPFNGNQRVLATCPEWLLGQQVSFPNSNWFEFNGGGTASNYWVTHFNTEDWWTLQGPNGGPPAQSLPKAAPGSDVYGFIPLYESLPGENFYRAHMVLRPDLVDPADIVDDGITSTDDKFTPFMSIGAEADAGNGGTLGSLGHWFTADHARVEFVSKLWNVVAPDEFFNHFVYFRTRWYSSQLDKNLDRMVFVALYGSDAPGAKWEPCMETTCTSYGPRVAWSWPIQESFFYPGADTAVTNVETLDTQCPNAVLGYDKLLTWGPGASEYPTSNRDERTYKFNITEIFDCLGAAGAFIDPVPSTYPLLGVHWGNEHGGEPVGTAGARLWTSVHGMTLY